MPIRVLSVRLWYVSRKSCWIISRWVELSCVTSSWVALECGFPKRKSLVMMTPSTKLSLAHVFLRASLTEASCGDVGMSSNKNGGRPAHLSASSMR
ncbi:hypothetical protein FKM82_028848 [Ascaphus truei]